MGMQPEDEAESARWESMKRPERPTSAPAPPPPAAGSFEDQQAAELANFKERWSAVQFSLVLPQVPSTTPPVGVRDGDVLIVGVGEYQDEATCAHMRAELTRRIGVAVEVVFIVGAGTQGVTVLRPER